MVSGRRFHCAPSGQDDRRSFVSWRGGSNSSSQHQHQQQPQQQRDERPVRLTRLPVISYVSAEY